jgi:hypothetical protein
MVHAALPKPQTLQNHEIMTKKIVVRLKTRAVAQFEEILHHIVAVHKWGYEMKDGRCQPLAMPLELQFHITLFDMPF